MAAVSMVRNAALQLVRLELLWPLQLGLAELFHSKTLLF